MFSNLVWVLLNGIKKEVILINDFSTDKTDDSIKDYINKRNGVDVNFTINDGYAKLDDINVTHYKIVKDRKATEYGWKQTYFIIDDFDIENYVLIPFNKFNEWEKTNLNRKNLNKKRGFNKYEEIVSKKEVV